MSDRNSTSSGFIRVQQHAKGQRHPDPAIAIDPKRLREALSRLESLSGQ